ncbi:MAG: hypothetical protein E5V25_30510, partial [Mesorhizobium sp.]
MEPGSAGLIEHRHRPLALRGKTVHAKSPQANETAMSRRRKMSKRKNGLTYAEAGVDIDAGNLM